MYVFIRFSYNMVLKTVTGDNFEDLTKRKKFIASKVMRRYVYTTKKFLLTRRIKFKNQIKIY